MLALVIVIYDIHRIFFPVDGWAAEVKSAYAPLAGSFLDMCDHGDHGDVGSNQRQQQCYLKV